MNHKVSEDENRILRKRIEELEAELAQAKATILSLTARQGDREPVDRAALVEAQNRAHWLARLPEENPNPVVRVSSEGIVIYRNRAAATLPGWGCAVDQPLLAALLPLVDSAFARGHAVEEQILLSGTSYWVYAVPFQEEGYANLYGRNITARKHAEEEVVRSRDELRKLNTELQQRNAELEIERARWQSVVEAIADELWVCDAGGRISLLNAPETIDTEEFRPSPATQTLQELDIPKPEEQSQPLTELPLLRSLHGETLRGEEIILNPRTGKMDYRQYSSAPMRDGQGSITGAVAIVHDITPLREAEQALADSRNRMNDILSSLGDGLLAIDHEWRLIYINQAAMQYVGQPAEELVGRNIWELWPGLRGSSVETLYREAMEKGIPGQVRTKGVVRTRLWFDVSVYPSSEGVTVYYIDKTEEVEAEETRKQLLEENREQSELLQAMFEADPGGIAVFTRHDLRFTFANQAYRDLLPQRGQDPVGRTLEEAWPPELGFHVLETYLPRGRENEPLTYDRITRTFPDGSNRHFSVHLKPINWHGKSATLVVAWENTQLEQAKAELEDYAEKLKRSNQDLQEFATIASHDLQEPLRKIEAYGELLAPSLQHLDERSREYAERMRNAAQRMRAMIEGLLQLSRVATQGMAFAAVDLTQVAREVVADLDGQIRRTHGKVEVEPLPIVEGDALQLHALMQNLISNALKYHKPHATPVVKVASRSTPEGATIVVTDNGIGFAQEDAERIFQPFQRLVSRGEYEGSGMGLAICRRIVERHKGRMWATSQPGEGSVFAVTLPEKGVSQ